MATGWLCAGVAVREFSSSQQMHPQHIKVSRRYINSVHDKFLASIFSVGQFDSQSFSPRSYGRLSPTAAFSTPGNAPHGIHTCAEQMLKGRGIVIARFIQRNFASHYIRGIEARRQCLQINQRSDQQTRSRDEDHRQRDFSGNQQHADLAMSRAGDCPVHRPKPSPTADRPSQFQRGKHPEQHAGRQRNRERKQQYAAIESKVSRRQQPSGIKCCSNARPPSATPKPAAPPIRASSMFSVHNCRIKAKGLAPSAIRVAISPLRRCARTSPKPARFAQAISRMKPTAIISPRTPDAGTQPRSAAAARFQMHCCSLYLPPSTNEIRPASPGSTAHRPVPMYCPASSRKRTP